jgi:glycosyltransferase involved in cell wall biosynthesis
MSRYGYIPKAERKKILLLCDDIRMHSGIATMAREFVVGTAHRYNWFNLGAALQHPDAGKILDISDATNKVNGLTDSYVKVMPSNGYGDAAKVRELIKLEKPDAIFIFTDPRYWAWLFEIEREIRSKIPIMWLNIWDEFPAPMYNRDYYRSVDTLMAISKQTKLINELVLGDEIKEKVIEYVPHGINTKYFFPIKEEHPQHGNLVEFKKNLFNGKDIEYVVFFNSRNIQRKHPADTILAYRQFCDLIGPEKAKKCALVMKTEISADHGTDLRAVKEALCDPEYVNVFFNTERLTPEQMNLLYNVADVTLLMSSNEGWGLALTESMMAGTMIIANTTGGMQDQMRFVDSDGKWFTPTPDIPSNHRGTYKEHGEWARPIFPTNLALMGSPATPYIFDDRCSPDDAAEALLEVYNLGEKERNRKGLLGTEWTLSEESNMSSEKMCDRIVDTMERGFKEFKPRPSHEIKKVEEVLSKRITHKLTGY